MKTKFEEDAKRSRAVQVAKHDEALQMITQLREENQSLKDELKKQKLSGMNLKAGDANIVILPHAQISSFIQNKKLSKMWSHRHQFLPLKAQ